MKILVLNSGSSSQKSSLYEIGENLPVDSPAPLWEGKIEWRDEVAHAEVKNSRGILQKGQVKVSSREKAVEHLLGTLWNGEPRTVTSPAEIDVVGHRVVHGGPKYAEPVLLTPEVKAGIAKVSAFAPLHNRAELEGMEVIEKLLGVRNAGFGGSYFDNSGPGRLGDRERVLAAHAGVSSSMVPVKYLCSNELKAFLSERIANCPSRVLRSRR